jgi:hypothetical protein
MEWQEYTYLVEELLNFSKVGRYNISGTGFRPMIVGGRTEGRKHCLYGSPSSICYSLA